MLICGNVISQEVLRLVCCTEEIPVGAPGRGVASDALEQRLQGTALVFCFCCSEKNRESIFLPLHEVALNCMRLCRSKMLPNLTLAF